MSLADTLFNNIQGGLADFAQQIEKQYKVQLSRQEETIKKLQERVEELEQYSDDQKNNMPLVNMHRFQSQEIDDILDEIELNNDGNQDNKEDAEDHDEDDQDTKKTSQFWQVLEDKLKERNIEFVKDLIRNKEIKMDETNSTGRNLLMLATEYGSYELARLSVNNICIDH